jgi:glycosyltransferase involved in cell wall biosynthesis
MISPIITFVIPSINRSTLQNSINSLLNQTNPNWKCIVVYDGIVGPIFEDDRILTITIDKTGVNTNKLGESGLVRNEGIKLCNTEWIGFLDDDDTLHQDYVKTLNDKYSNYDFVVWRMKNTDGLIIPRLNKNQLVLNNVGISFCYKNKFKDILFDSNIAGEDFYFVDKLQKITTNFIITPEVYYNIRH